jgi:hypothetical protein
MSTRTPTNLSLQECWIDTHDGSMREDFDRRPFLFDHHLVDHPLLQIPSLMELAERMLKDRPDAIYYDMGDIRVDQRWDEVPERKFSILESMERIQNCGAWFLFKKVQYDAQYAEFLGEGWQKIKAKLGKDLDSKIRREDALIFITSPRRVAAYHIDRECSFLLQIHGTKTIHVFDRDDRDVLPEEELERYWTVDHNAPKYKPELQGRAKSYVLRPGTGIHIPVNFPHWVENGDNVSVSLNVNVQFKDTERANVYRANYALRRLGLKPTPPGKSEMTDRLKAHSMVPVVAAKPLFRMVRNAMSKRHA